MYLKSEYDKCQQSFDQMGVLLIEASVLVQPETHKLIVYASRMLGSHEKNCLIHDLNWQLLSLH
ncbi:hypothetical protein EPI10_016235 [Gossypium australe]|uniref:Uncharacterized protein n=1 Tax=Gossypium australe TaxID=47621 RepID=A0A5B6VN96_9ROSI|nr:hypothetical protein EPI10_016235 [Gossypium australe]